MKTLVLVALLLTGCRSAPSQQVIVPAPAQIPPSVKALYLTAAWAVAERCGKPDADREFCAGWIAVCESYREIVLSLGPQNPPDRQVAMALCR